MSTIVLPGQLLADNLFYRVDAYIFKQCLPTLEFLRNDKQWHHLVHAMVTDALRLKCEWLYDYPEFAPAVFRCYERLGLGKESQAEFIAEEMFWWFLDESEVAVYFRHHVIGAFYRNTVLPLLNKIPSGESLIWDVVTGPNRDLILISGLDYRIALFERWETTGVIKDIDALCDAKINDNDSEDPDDFAAANACILGQLRRK